MQEALPWIIALAVLVVIAAGMAFWVTRPHPLDSAPLPQEWAVGPRTVFTVDERRAYRQLREAFAQHIVLAKLPLIRFCQPTDAQDMRYWFDLLGSIHVSFAVCSAHGRVLATIDLDGERPSSRRTQQIKQSVLSACRIRYLRCTIDHLPSVSELQMLLPAQAGSDAPQGSPQPAPVPASTPRGSAESPAGTAAAAGSVPAIAWPAGAAAQSPQRPAAAAAQIVRDVKPSDARPRKERKALWQDSGLFQDSFFGIDNLRDAGPQSDIGSLLNEAGRGRSPAPGPEISADPDQGVLESELAKLRSKPR
jgi:hypothetical protein